MQMGRFGAAHDDYGPGNVGGPGRFQGFEQFQSGSMIPDGNRKGQYAGAGVKYGAGLFRKRLTQGEFRDLRAIL
jgi:hypothetical protein